MQNQLRPCRPIAGRLRHLPVGLLAGSLTLLLPDSAGGQGQVRPPAIVGSFHETQKVHALAQTPDGFLWAGTDSGLLRFDGKNFRTFTTGDTPGLAGNIVRALMVDRGGSLWMGFELARGLSRMRDGVIEAIDVGDDLSTFAIDAILATRGGDLFFGGKEGLLFLRPGSPRGAVRVAKLSGTRVFKLHETGDGRLFAATEAGLFLRQGNTFVEVGDFGRVMAVASNAKGEVWFSAMEQPLLRLEADGRATAMLGRPGKDAGQVTISALTFDREDGLWLGWEAGFGRLVGTTISPSFQNALITVDLLADREGGVFAATYWGVVQRAGRPRVENQVWSGAGELPLVFSVAVANDQALWLSQVDSVVRVAGDQVTRFASGNELPGWCPRSLARAAAGGVWLSTCDAGLLRFKDGAFSLVPSDDPAGTRDLQAVFEDRSGTVWAGSERGELWKLVGGRLQRRPLKNGVCPPTRPGESNQLRSECAFSPNAFIDAAGGGIWVSTRRNGLRRIAPDGGVTAWSTANGLPTDHLLALHEDADGTLWIGTQAHGVLRFRAGEVRAIDTRHGLPAQSIHGIAADEHGRFWMSSERGVFRVARADLQALLAGARSGVRGSVYGLRDGLASLVTLQSYPGTIAYLPDRRLVVPTDRGLAVIHTERIEDTAGFSGVVLEGVRIDGAAVTGKAVATHPINLPFGQAVIGSLEFDLSLPNFEVPERVRIQYRLRGHDEDFLETRGGEALRFGKLSPGRYQLEVRPVLDGKPWAPARVVTSLRVVGFTQRPAFFALLSLGLLPLAGLAYIVRLRLQRARFGTVMQERNRIARDLHDSLAQYFTGIAFQLERLSTVMRDNPDLADAITEETKTMLAQCRLETRQAIHNLRSQALAQQSFIDSLHAFAADTRMAGRAKIEVNVRGTPLGKPLPEATTRQLLRIAQEATVNALTHARATHVFVSVEFAGDALTLEIHDDGEGFNDEEEQKAKPLHFGLRGMRERAEALGGSFVLESHEGEGTTVKVKVSV